MEMAPHMKSVLEKLGDMVKDPNFRLEGANACNLAYHLGEGGSEADYKVIDDKDQRA